VVTIRQTPVTASFGKILKFARVKFSGFVGCVSTRQLSSETPAIENNAQRFHGRYLALATAQQTLHLISGDVQVETDQK